MVHETQSLSLFLFFIRYVSTSTLSMVQLNILFVLSYRIFYMILFIPFHSIPFPLLFSVQCSCCNCNSLSYKIVPLYVWFFFIFPFSRFFFSFSVFVRFQFAKEFTHFNNNFICILCPQHRTVQFRRFNTFGMYVLNRIVCVCLAFLSERARLSESRSHT